jgi:hypothetical protein
VSDSKEVFLSVHTHLRFSAEKYSMQTLPLSHKFKENIETPLLKLRFITIFIPALDFQ